ncbi:pirin [Mycoavidus cysteinexigens]|uniref:Pirin n=1 Tax=Mycoavidus cysteinexigens TaxID=1553431 RepID=A0A2Z6EV10_9BURK|nr:pirin family protein [Mycoavidus cysteinexigens]BBE09284.1 pirin [Mycoavidus cysteinexigens]GAM51959.1 pirin [bacterium endosymbiont of Mortierella elongata FMR23-6]GLR02058.1 quercetin 2,3-dioxygenase [Mycoavidus cysteinexigens]
MKKVVGVYNAPSQHWVGDGFPVRSLFSYRSHSKTLSPFLLLDYAGPTEFAPSHQPRGVGQHPHRGFETVTIVYKGEIAHHDSTGQSGVIRSGDVQWMTAASGILHEEFHSEAFTQAGGAFEVVQLWVNLPAKDKMSAPGYQTIPNEVIPKVPLPNGAGSVRVIAGDYSGHAGPARTFSPMNVWDIRLSAGAAVELPAAEGWNTAVVVLHGAVQVDRQVSTREVQMALFEREGDSFMLEANSDAVVLLLSGEPIDEPIVGHGPFVMNTREEIVQALNDFNSGRF